MHESEIEGIPVQVFDAAILRQMQGFFAAAGSGVSGSKVSPFCGPDAAGTPSF
ncbi:hypothetical protein ABIB48_003400 [Arthrobacter sp. UYCu511]|uniref:hypothetical protein n=1 Tax=Arthrobacter sp. UYCu511 TaxID=3156337 RepID=UPI00339329AE